MHNVLGGTNGKDPNFVIVFKSKGLVTYFIKTCQWCFTLMIFLPRTLVIVPSIFNNESNALALSEGIGGLRFTSRTFL